MSAHVETEDLEHILKRTSHLWKEVKDQNIFITGGTGFFGCWLVESFAWINDHLNLNAKAFVLSRDPESFAHKAPHLVSHPSIHLVQGDVRSFDFPKEEFRFVIHAATETGTRPNQENPLLMLETIVEGTRRTLELAHTHGTKKFLLTSSGAIYGKQPAEMTNIVEDYNGAPDPLDPGAAYAEGKRVAEILCRLYYDQIGLGTKIARCFAFLGPYLPLDSNFAIGNFIRDAYRGGPIRVNGDGTPCRSYLYAADLTIWLWTILFNGKPCRPYNVGSDRSISISDLAQLLCKLSTPGIDIKIASRATPEQPPLRYVPSVDRARSELSLESWTSLERAIEKTFKWLNCCEREMNS
jgi:nucleoside-diphosphate-sugar epimerase